MKDFDNNIHYYISNSGRDYNYPSVIDKDKNTYQNQDTINIDASRTEDSSDDTELPSYNEENAMCMEVKATSWEYDEVLDLYTYHTGIKFDLPKTYGILVFPAKTINNTEVYVPNAVDVIDLNNNEELVIKFKYRTNIKIFKYFNDTLDNIKKIFDKINEIIEVVNQHSTDIEDIKTDIDSINSEISSIWFSISSINSDISSINSEISSLWSAISSLESSGGKDSGETTINALAKAAKLLAETRAATTIIEKLVIKELDKFKDYDKEPYAKGDIIAKILFLPYVKVNFKTQNE